MGVVYNKSNVVAVLHILLTGSSKIVGNGFVTTDCTNDSELVQELSVQVAL